MIIGNGDIAKALFDREDFTFFASGVSNSLETRESEFDREWELLMNQITGRHFVYFSSLSIFFKDSPYTRHKRLMEKLIKLNFDSYTIVRLGNITWGNNPNTFINYLKKHPEAPIFDEYRYVVDKEEFIEWMDHIPEWSCEMNITGKRMKVADIMKQYGNS